MDTQSNVWGWVVGIIVVVVIVGGVWWWMSSSNTPAPQQTGNSNTEGQLTGTVEVGSNATSGPAI